MTMRIVWPAQCVCGHIFLEKYSFNTANERGEVGFCWCGFCRTKLMVKQLPDLLVEKVKS